MARRTKRIAVTRRLQRTPVAMAIEDGTTSLPWPIYQYRDEGDRVARSNVPRNGWKGRSMIMPWLAHVGNVPSKSMLVKGGLAVAAGAVTAWQADKFEDSRGELVLAGAMVGGILVMGGTMGRTIPVPVRPSVQHVIAGAAAVAAGVSIGAMVGPRN